MNLSTSGPQAAYQTRLSELRQEQTVLESRRAWLGNGRFLLLVGFFLLLIPTFAQPILSPWWLVLPAIGFLVLSWYFDKATRRQHAGARAIHFYERGLARLEERWAGTGIPGTEYQDEQHLFAADLDLFGRGSLYEWLCDARTRSGRDTLARWLTGPAAPEEVRARQEAVRDLRDRLSWRETLAVQGAGGAESINTTALVTWGAAVPPLGPAWPRFVAPILAGITVLTGFGWGLGWLPPSPFLAALLVQMGFGLWLRPRVLRALDGLAGRSRDLFRLAGILTAVEGEKFAAPRLVQLQTELQKDGRLPSEELSRLWHLMDLLDWTHNPFFGVIALFLLWTTQVALAIERWRQRTGPSLGRWFAVVGEVEALASLAGNACENPDDPFPDVVAEGPLYDGEGLGHPLLPRAACVTNDVRLDRELRLLVVSGSNMSGKSTFLRTVGVAAVLAMAGGVVRAKRLRLSPLAIGATLRIQDSLQSGKSRFYAEITRLRQVVELTRGPWPLLFLFDELLQGTNSHDRRIGAEAILRSLLEKPALGLVTTHDLSLTQIADDLKPHAANVHFADVLRDGTLHFDYRLHQGVVQHSNALDLMRSVGLIG